MRSDKKKKKALGEAEGLFTRKNRPIRGASR